MLGVVSVQIGAAFAKLLFDDASPTTIVWLRLATSTLVLSVWARPRLRGRTWEAWRPALGLGICLATMNWAIYQSFSRIPIGIAVTIELAGPLLFAAVHSRRRADLTWIALAAVGVTLLGLRPSGITWAGVAFAVAAAAAWAGYIHFAARTGQTWTGVEGLAIASVIALAVLSPLALGAHGGDLGSARLWLIGALVGLLSSVIPYSAEMIALRSLSPVVFGVLVSLDPAAAALAGLAVVGETLTTLQWVAVACVIAASIGMTRPRSLAGRPGGGWSAREHRGPRSRRRS